MLDVIGFDSRIFIRESKKRNGKTGRFESVLGVGIRVQDYDKFDKKYQEIFQEIFDKYKLEKKYKYYCFNDIKDIPCSKDILAEFFDKIEPEIYKAHIFYSMFSSKRIPEAKVYGRMSREQNIKLSSPTMTYKKLTSSHLVNVFPAICAWRLIGDLNSSKTQFHLDAFIGHNFEAYEELMKGNFSKFVFTSGDCINPVISTADLLIAFIDIKLEEEKRLLTFESFRGVLPKFKEKVLVKPISNTHLPKITPIEKKPILPYGSIKRPVYWLFKGEDLIDSGVLKRSKTYRNLLDVISYRGGCVKLFSKSDAENIESGDVGIYMNSAGEEIIKSYAKIGKKLIKQKLDLFVKD